MASLVLGTYIWYGMVRIYFVWYNTIHKEIIEREHGTPYIDRIMLGTYYHYHYDPSQHQHPTPTIFITSFAIISHLLYFYFLSPHCCT